MFKFSKRSKDNLEGVHKDLVAVVKRALEISEVDFVVIEGLRTRERQEKLFDIGASTILNSRHITGHAVDIVPWVDGVRWDWPLYFKLADAMFEASEQLSIPIEWGGNWKTFKDGAHFQLPKNQYA